MHGVRLVSTPAKNSSGRARSGLPNRVPAMFEKSIERQKLLMVAAIRKQPRLAFTCSRFQAGRPLDACGRVASGADCTRLEQPVGVKMHFKRIYRLALALVPL